MDFRSGHLEWNCIEKLVQQNTITVVGMGHGDGIGLGVLYYEEPQVGGRKIWVKVHILVTWGLSGYLCSIH